MDEPIYHDILSKNTKRGERNVNTSEICDFGSCQNMAYKYGVCRKHLPLEEPNGSIKQGKEKCQNCGNLELITAKYENGALWLECEKCYSAIRPLNKIAEEN